jgi:hypothetical protein
LKAAQSRSKAQRISDAFIGCSPLRHLNFPKPERIRQRRSLVGPGTRRSRVANRSEHKLATTMMVRTYDNKLASATQFASRDFLRKIWKSLQNRHL